MILVATFTFKKTEILRRRVRVFRRSVVSDSCDPIDCSPPGSSVHGILQARGGLPFPSPGDLPNPGIEARSPALQTDSLPTELPGKSLEKLFPP